MAPPPHPLWSPCSGLAASQRGLPCCGAIFLLIRPRSDTAAPRGVCPDPGAIVSYHLPGADPDLSTTGVAPPGLVLGFPCNTAPFVLCSPRVPTHPRRATTLHGGATARSVSAALVLPQALSPPLFPLSSLYASVVPVPGENSVFFTAALLFWCLTLARTSGALLPGRYVRVRRRSCIQPSQPLLPRTLMPHRGVRIPAFHPLPPCCHAGCFRHFLTLRVPSLVPCSMLPFRLSTTISFPYRPLESTPPVACSPRPPVLPVHSVCFALNPVAPMMTRMSTLVLLLPRPTSRVRTTLPLQQLPQHPHPKLFPRFPGTVHAQARKRLEASILLQRPSSISGPFALGLPALPTSSLKEQVPRFSCPPLVLAAHCT